MRTIEGLHFRRIYEGNILPINGNYCERGQQSLHPRYFRRFRLFTAVHVAWREADHRASSTSLTFLAKAPGPNGFCRNGTPACRTKDSWIASAV